MKQKHLDFSSYKREILKNTAVKKEYDLLQPKFALIEAVLKARKEKDMTQEELARKVGTRQSAISRLEIGSANPSIAFLHKIAGALNTHLEIKLIPD